LIIIISNVGLEVTLLIQSTNVLDITCVGTA